MFRQRWFSLVPAAMVIALAAVPFSAVAYAAEESRPDDAAAKSSGDAAAEATDVPEGHSYHGEVFNEGPRQAAYLMDGVGNVRFDVTTTSDEARAFVQQGVAQLHGFWYFESERSFRQAAMLDPDCAIAYWGMAMSNRKNESRAKGFIEEAKKRRDQASKREQRYIDSLHTYLTAKSGSDEEKRLRTEAYVRDLDDLLVEFPDDIEARAFLAEFMWSARSKELKGFSHRMTDALIQEVLDAELLHPVHHYRIHLWDGRKPENAVESSARCGPAAPAIAHMWHMPGHIYSKLKRYHDAIYQQEASARVDHAHMMKDRVMPDQIHNFAHNNEWCIRNLIKIGRVQDGIELAKNMVSMPRHPQWNHIGKSGSFKYGRQRLADMLRAWQLHDQLLAYSQTAYFGPVDSETEDLTRQRYIAAAYAAVGKAEQAAGIRGELQSALDAEQKEQQTAGVKAQQEATEAKKSDDEVKKSRKQAEDKFNSRIRDLEKAIAEIDGRLAAGKGQFEEALQLFKKADGVPTEEVIAVMLQAGKPDDAVKRAAQNVTSNRNEVRPLICQVETLWAVGKKEEAKKAFEQLRTLSQDIDSHLPVVRRLEPIAEELGFGKSWQTVLAVRNDIGARPPLDSLGPFRWEPVAAPLWSLTNQDEKTVSLADHRGRPVIVIFYLGAGCLHCAEQIQKFGKHADQFRNSGFDIVAVSTDKQRILRSAWKDLEHKLPFDLVSDAELSVFKQYRCYDDFEQQALHGTFLIDGTGRVRWQDISYEPFMDADFLLEEGQRLLQLDRPLSSEAESLASRNGK